MNDVLFIITSKLDNQGLCSLYQVPDAWSQIVKYQQDQEWWYLRVQYLVGVNLRRRENEDWREAYRVLSLLDLSYKQRNSNVLVNDILIEIGKYSIASCRRCNGTVFYYAEIGQRRGDEAPSEPRICCENCDLRL